jgi:hypothetical protein
MFDVSHIPVKQFQNDAPRSFIHSPLIYTNTAQYVIKKKERKMKKLTLETIGRKKRKNNRKQDSIVGNHFASRSIKV